MRGVAYVCVLNAILNTVHHVLHIVDRHGLWADRLVQSVNQQVKSKIFKSDDC